jgi:hypothetical protein
MNRRLRRPDFDADPILGRYSLFLKIISVLAVSCSISFIHFGNSPSSIPRLSSWRDLNTSDDVTALTFSTRGSYFALGHSDGSVSIWGYSSTAVMVKSLVDPNIESEGAGTKKKKDSKHITSLR